MGFGGFGHPLEPKVFGTPSFQDSDRAHVSFAPVTFSNGCNFSFTLCNTSAELERGKELCN
jgi:hypothetical protein